MAALIPSSNVEAAYEDMFKEITRKLYGEETGNGLHTLGTPVAQVATTGPTAPEGERSFTNLIDRSSAPTIEYEHNAVTGQTTTAAASATVAAAAAAAAAATAGNVVIQQQPEGSVVVATTGGGGNFKSEDQLSTAFGLAALMQNGFATTTAGTLLNTQAINKVVTNAVGQQQQGQTIVGDQQRWTTDGSATGGVADQQQQQQQQQQPQIVQWTTTTGGKLQSYTTAQQQQQTQVSPPKSKSKNSTASTSDNTITIYTSPSAVSVNNIISGPNQVQQQQQQQQTATSTSNSSSSSGGGGSSSRKKSNNSQQNANNNGGVQVQKRYACTHCPYSTDRRDLYTRHENIHKDEKPFQCYSCLKQFNRADHVKKHFLRMHRELEYDINKTRRHVPNSTSNHHSGGRGNITINVATAGALTIDNAFLESQRQPTSSSLSIAETIEAVATAADAPLPQMKQEKCDDGSVVGGNGTAGVACNIKPKKEKRFQCCYCPWCGADKWGLKRHLNTHTKPYVCQLCDYKAARSERLATHVLKVHNKRACNKCAYLSDTQEEYQLHLTEVHPHDNRPSRNNSHNNNNNATNNLNVLRTIGNTLVTNNQLNTFQNASTTFGVGNTTTTTTTNAVGNGGGGSVTIYTTTTTNDNGNVGGSVGNISTGGPLQEIIVNPTSMVGWRLSANGSLIPPHDLLTGGCLPNAAAQKRGSERLFQYLEADGSDPEDYARLLKMDAISRNTASVAQDFRKAGGVHELRIPANQLLFKNKLPSQWTTLEAATLLQSLSNSGLTFQDQQQKKQHTEVQQQLQRLNANGVFMNAISKTAANIEYLEQQQLQQQNRLRQCSTGDDENTPSSSPSTTSRESVVTPTKLCQDDANVDDQAREQRKAMTAFLSTNFGLQEKNMFGTAVETTAPAAATPSTPSLATAEAIANELVRACSSNNLNGKRKYQQHHIDNDENQENNEQLIKSPPAYIKNSNNKNNPTRNRTTHRHRNANATITSNGRDHHRLDLQHPNHHQHLNDRDNKENTDATTFLTTMEYQNINKIGTQFQNYVKDIINKYYTEISPQMFVSAEYGDAAQQQEQQQLQLPMQQQASSPPKKQRVLSETEEYIEYLKNKEDITLTILPKNPKSSKQQKQQERATTIASPNSSCAKQQQQPLLKPQQEMDPATTLFKRQTRQTPKKPLQHVANGEVAVGNKKHKSITQLATLLPLLADAASQQQYLATPLDFSKSTATERETVIKNNDHMNKIHITSTMVMPPTTNSTTTPPPSTVPVKSSQDKRSSRKQAQPKKIRTPPEVVVAMLRDKYLNRMVDRKLSCRLCASANILVFNYHTKASLALHRLWKHTEHTQYCSHCNLKFKHHYSLNLHRRRLHARKISAVKKQINSTMFKAKAAKKYNKQLAGKIRVKLFN